MPATAKFLHAIAKLPQGAVILPGLDTSLDEAAWTSIGGIETSDGTFSTLAWSHPQFALHNLITRVFGITRDDVVTLGEPAAHGREVLTSEAMRPAASSALWHTRLEDKAIAQEIASGSRDLVVIEAANPEMEALSIAVAMREARHQNITAALVTPDRTLARRVMAALARWNLEFDDLGRRFPHGHIRRNLCAARCGSGRGWIGAGDIARALEASAVSSRISTRGLDQRRCRPRTGAAARNTARARKRGLGAGFRTLPRRAREIKTQEASTIHASEPRAQLSDVRLAAVQMLIERLSEAFKPLEEIKPGKPCDISDLAARHRQVLMALSRDDKDNIWAFEEADGDGLSRAFDDLLGIAW